MSTDPAANLKLRVFISSVQKELDSRNFILDEGIERMGTGIRDMIRRCGKAGLLEPEIRLDGGFFVLTFRRKKPESGAQVGTRLAPSGHQVGQQPESQVTPSVNLSVAPRSTGSRKRVAYYWSSCTREETVHERSREATKHGNTGGRTFLSANKNSWRVGKPALRCGRRTRP